MSGQDFRSVGLSTDICLQGRRQGKWLEWGEVTSGVQGAAPPGGGPGDGAPWWGSGGEAP